jgi:hypothetical protein
MLNIEKLQMAHADKQALDKLLKKRLRKFAADTALSFTTVTVFVTRAGLEATARCPSCAKLDIAKLQMDHASRALLEASRVTWEMPPAHSVL